MKRQPLINSLLLTGSVAMLVATPAQAQVAQVTAVRLNQTPSGWEAILETQDGRPLQTFSASYGRVFIADIITTQLRLPEGNAFRADHPDPGINSVQVIPLDTNTIQVRIVSETDTPVAQIQRSDRGLALSVGTLGTTAVRPTPTTPLPGLEIPPTEPTQPPSEPGAVVPPVPIPVDPTQPSGEPGCLMSVTR